MRTGKLCKLSRHPLTRPREGGKINLLNKYPPCGHGLDGTERGRPHDRSRPRPAGQPQNHDAGGAPALGHRPDGRALHRLLSDHLHLQPGGHLLRQLPEHGGHGGGQRQRLPGSDHYDGRVHAGGGGQQLHRPAAGGPAGRGGQPDPVLRLLSGHGLRRGGHGPGAGLHGPHGPAAGGHRHLCAVRRRLRRLRAAGGPLHGRQLCDHPVPALGGERGAGHGGHGLRRHPQLLHLLSGHGGEGRLHRHRHLQAGELRHFDLPLRDGPERAAPVPPPLPAHGGHPGADRQRGLLLPVSQRPGGALRHRAQQHRRRYLRLRAGGHRGVH